MNILKVTWYSNLNEEISSEYFTDEDQNTDILSLMIKCKAVYEHHPVVIQGNYAMFTDGTRVEITTVAVQTLRDRSIINVEPLQLEEASDQEHSETNGEGV